jgi:hypothetical protein
MILLAKGQINYISPVETFDKGRRKKVVIAITQENTFKKNQLEFVPYELLDEKVGWVEEYFLGVGDYIEISFEQRGRKYIPDHSPDKPIFYISNELLSIVEKN